MFIIAAIGHNSLQESGMKKIILAGADILRLNFSYRNVAENINYIKQAQKIIDELHASTKILIDFPLDKIRLGNFDIKVFAVRENEQFIFQSASYSSDCNSFIPVDTPNIGDKVSPSQTITIGDGEVAIQVLEVISSQRIRVGILNNGVILYCKSFNIAMKPEAEKIIASYKPILDALREIQPDMVAFTHFDKQIDEEIKKTISEYKLHSKNILKIERPVELKDMNHLCEDNFYNMIMIDRGELAVNMPYEKMGVMQRQIIETANKHSKPVIVSTQILESTINNLTPNRPEISDLTNMVIDGVSGIMLCHETAMGQRPAYSIKVARKIIDEAEKYKKKL